MKFNLMKFHLLTFYFNEAPKEHKTKVIVYDVIVYDVIVYDVIVYTKKKKRKKNEAFGQCSADNDVMCCSDAVFYSGNATFFRNTCYAVLSYGCSCLRIFRTTFLL